MLKKIYQELVMIRQELQRIRRVMEFNSENNVLDNGTLDYIKI